MSIFAPSIPREFADAIHDILAAECGLDDGGYCARDVFAHHQGHGCVEFRFVGSLGFGGKFWNSGGQWWVSLYHEDGTPERLVAVERANTRLAELRTKYVLGGRP